MSASSTDPRGDALLLVAIVKGTAFDLRVDALDMAMCGSLLVEPDPVVRTVVRPPRPRLSRDGESLRPVAAAACVGLP
jgi:hypothetical protein